MFKSLITSVIVSLVTFSAASAKMSLEEKEFKAINAFVAMQIYLAKTDQALFKFDNLDDIKLVEYQAQQIADEFYENEIASEKKYKGVPLIINGKVDHVTKMSNYISISYNTRNDDHGNMSAMLDKRFENVAANFTKGSSISLACGGVIEDIIPSAYKCYPKEWVLFAEDRQAEKITNSFLKGEVIDQYMKAKDGHKPAPAQLFFYKFAARYLPDNSPCLSWEKYEACDYQPILPNNGKLSGVKEYRDAYFQSQDFYHLP